MANPHSACMYATRARILHAIGLLVLTLAGGRIGAIRGFDNSVLPLFGFPRTLPD